MSEKVTTIIGYIGGTLLNITFIPQIYKTFKTKQTEDISLLFMIMQFITSIFCLTYSILLGENPLIISNSILFVQISLLFTGKILYSHVYVNKLNNINEVNINEVNINEVKKITFL